MSEEYRHLADLNVNMHKMVCLHCNILRGICGHCWGAVACIRAVTTVGKTGKRTAEIAMASKWGLHTLSTKAEPPPKFIPAGERPKRTGFATLADVWPKQVQA